MKVISDKKENMKRDVNIFDKNVIFGAIAGVVSKLENKKYVVDSVGISENLNIVYLYCNDISSWIQVACCVDDSSEVDFSWNWENIHDDCRGYSCIVNKEYLYILDFIKYVKNYRLLKIKNDVSVDELTVLENLFVYKYLKEENKKILSNNARNKSRSLRHFD